MLVKERKINKSVFYLMLVETREGFDFVVSGPNWCSGQLRAHYGWSEQEITEYFEKSDLEADVNSSWEAHYERIIGC